MAVAGLLSVAAFGACSKHSSNAKSKATTTTAGPALGPSQSVTTTATVPTTGDFITQYGFDEIRPELVQNGFLDGAANTRSDGVLVLRLHFQGRDGASESQSIVDGVAPATGAQATAVSGTTLIVARAPDAATARRVAQEEAAR